MKYPPSISFLLITLGINLTILSFFSLEGRRGRWLITPLAVLGRVPLFFYLLHLFLFALIGRAIGPEKISLAVMYGFWISGLVFMYPFCTVYARLKQQSSPSSFMRYI